MDPIKIATNLINLLAKLLTMMYNQALSIQVSPTHTMTEKIHNIGFKTTNPSLRGRIHERRSQLHKKLSRQLKARMLKLKHS